ncbi:hypothetical protein SKAU_G00201080 [Synaphobranchus kaupii]|uniref:Uncharacterized protein n=1 Tax=Synaphobranchus kaupii TaxID=118154 RepID=A0A9Q1FFI5_SYNKA|nr:hypothetical protein SKAU_G00201080 [Synaphobranchus kaupii]
MLPVSKVRGKRTGAPGIGSYVSRNTIDIRSRLRKDRRDHVGKFQIFCEGRRSVSGKKACGEEPTQTEKTKAVTTARAPATTGKVKRFTGAMTHRGNVADKLRQDDD